MSYCNHLYSENKVASDYLNFWTILTSLLYLKRYNPGSSGLIYSSYSDALPSLGKRNVHWQKSCFVVTAFTSSWNSIALLTFRLVRLWL